MMKFCIRNILDIFTISSNQHTQVIAISVQITTYTCKQHCNTVKVSIRWRDFDYHLMLSSGRCQVIQLT